MLAVRAGLRDGSDRLLPHTLHAREAQRVVTGRVVGASLAIESNRQGDASLDVAEDERVPIRRHVADDHGR